MQHTYVIRRRREMNDVCGGGGTAHVYVDLARDGAVARAGRDGLYGGGALTACARRTVGFKKSSTETAVPTSASHVPTVGNTDSRDSDEPHRWSDAHAPDGVNSGHKGCEYVTATAAAAVPISST